MFLLPFPERMKSILMKASAAFFQLKFKNLTKLIPRIFQGDGGVQLTHVNILAVRKLQCL